MMKSFIDDRLYEYYTGNEHQPFNSKIMGKHQWLENGNLLITESMNGRAFELNNYKEIVWEYYNNLNNDKRGIVQDATRVPREKLKFIYN